jgi:hypothetical protein
VNQFPGHNWFQTHFKNGMILYGYEHKTMICTYLNSHLLGAPREYVLHGLDPGLDWASFWPSIPRAFRVATPHSVSCCLSQMNHVSHLSPPLLSGWLLTNVQVNNITELYDTHGHAYTVYLHHSGITILLSSFLLTLPPIFLADQLAQTLSVWYNNHTVKDGIREWTSVFHNHSAIYAKYKNVCTKTTSTLQRRHVQHLRGTVTYVATLERYRHNTKIRKKS